jgi:ATP-dependent RNA helicase RhlE
MRPAKPAGALPRESVHPIVFSYHPRRARRPLAHPTPRSEARAPATHARPPVDPPPPPAPRVLTPEVTAAMAASPFAPLGLIAPLLRAVVEEGYTQPTPVQTQVVPHALAGRDVLACAQTGTGKTAAFVLPILQRLTAAGPSTGRIRVLIVAPTRELAAQIDERVAAYGRYLSIRHTVVFGGVTQHRQEVALQRAPDVLSATPGRLLDLMQQGFVKLDGVTHFVLDEADRMLDMGFINDVRRICSALPKVRQTLLFSATIPPAIESLARGMLVDPARVSVTPAVTTAPTVEQSVVFVEKADKRAMLERVLRASGVERALVFTRTKHGANRLLEHLGRAGIDSAAIHGNKSQGARLRALEAFRDGTTRVLVATDLAARGIDVDGISHVINFDLPADAECYVHRIGRTGRAGAVGRAISFCDRDERGLLADIERLIRHRLPVGSA